MPWLLSQLAIWLLVLIPAFFATRCLLARIRHLRCGVPLMLIVLALAAALALLLTPVALPLGAVVLPYSALTVIGMLANFQWGAPQLGLSWQELAPPRLSLAVCFLMASALLWMILQRDRR
jgi:hypothetical protein